MGQLDIRLLLMICLAIPGLLTVSFLYTGEDEDRGITTVTLILNFGTDHPTSLQPGNHTNWENGRIIASHPTADHITIHEFRNITGENQSVLDVLRTAAHWSNISVETTAYPALNGIFVDAIAGVENGEANWRYAVNGEYGTHASDLRKVRNNDRILWEYR